MAEEKITIVDLRKSVARHAGLPEEQVGRFFSALFPEIIEGLKKDKSVRISGLGTFKLIWIEPRKSVNVQTGEPIMLEGYNKLSFIPESYLREQINEPYADLDPQEVDENGNPTQPRSTRNGEDPMKRLGEQAQEIKDLLADLGVVTAPAAATVSTQAVTPVEETPAAEEPVIAELPTEAIIEKELTETAGATAETTETTTEEPNTATEPETTESTVEEPVKEEQKTVELIITEPVVTEPVIIEPAATEPITAPTSSVEKPYIPNYSSWDDDQPQDNKKKREGKKSLWWLWVLIITVLVLAGLLVGAYFFGQHIIEKWADKLNGKTEFVQNTAMQPAELAEEVDTYTMEDSLALTAEEMPQTEPEAKKKSVYEEREYSEFTGIETVKEGSRLTWISKKYYGTKDYWVYIYEANRDVISDPGRIEVGTKLRIPKLPEELTDPNNPRAVELAKKLHDEYSK